MERSSYASQAVLTAPPPERAAMRNTPGTHTLDSRALTKPALQHEQQPTVSRATRQSRRRRQEGLTERVRALDDDFVRHERAHALKQEQIQDEGEEREEESLVGRGLCAMGEEQTQAERDDEHDQHHR